MPVNKNDTVWGSEGSDRKWYCVNSDITNENRIVVQGNVGLILQDGKTLTVPAGITVGKDAQLSIFGCTEQTGKLLAGTKANPYNAGIGGEKGDSGSISIFGGDIEANGGSCGAGIGGGWKDESSTAGDIAIYRGTVTAISGYYASAIGAGAKGDFKNIEIYGGNVNATALEHGAGLGAKFEDSLYNNGTFHDYDCGGKGNRIYICGDNTTVYAGGSGAPGIGADKCDIEIDGGSVTAVNRDYKVSGYSGETAIISAPGIGVSAYADGEPEINIKGGTVKATGGTNSPGIGASALGTYYGTANYTLKITGGDITATAGGDGAAIGNGTYVNGGVINISGGNINATSTTGAAIGCGMIPDNNTYSTAVNISGGNIKLSIGSDDYNGMTRSPAYIGTGVTYRGSQNYVSGTSTLGGGSITGGCFGAHYEEGGNAVYDKYYEEGGNYVCDVLVADNYITITNPDSTEYPCKVVYSIIEEVTLNGYEMGMLGDDIPTANSKALYSAFSIPDDANYTLDWINWADDTKEYQRASGKFEEGKKYYIYAQFDTKTGYYFAPDVVVNVPGAKGVKRDVSLENTRVILYTEREEPSTIIKEITLKGYCKQVVGDEINNIDLYHSLSVPDDARYYLTSASWTDENGSSPSINTFEQGKKYSVHAEFKAKDGFTFASGTQFNVPGVSNVSGANDVLLESGIHEDSTKASLRTVPVEPYRLITNVDITDVPMPKAGEYGKNYENSTNVTTAGLTINDDDGKKFASWYNVTDKEGMSQSTRYKIGKTYRFLVQLGFDPDKYTYGILKPTVNGREAKLEDPYYDCFDIAYFLTLGDANGDGKVDENDTAAILKYTSGTIDDVNIAGDVNADNKVDLLDAIIIEQGIKK